MDDHFYIPIAIGAIFSIIIVTMLIFLCFQLSKSPGGMYDETPYFWNASSGQRGPDESDAGNRPTLPSHLFRQRPEAALPPEPEASSDSPTAQTQFPSDLRNSPV